MKWNKATEKVPVKNGRYICYNENPKIGNNEYAFHFLDFYNEVPEYILIDLSISAKEAKNCFIDYNGEWGHFRVPSDSLWWAEVNLAFPDGTEVN